MSETGSILVVRESDRGGGDAAVRVLENAELKYTLEELLKKKRRSCTLQPLCCKILSRNQTPEPECQGLDLKSAGAGTVSD